MGNKQAVAPSEADDIESITDCLDADISRRRINIPMVQNVLLIWLDDNTDEIDIDCLNRITELRGQVNNIETFTNGEKCIQFINNITDNKACIIISDSFSQHIVPRVHDMSQVDSIFILCDNKEHHEQWIRDWSKIKGAFTDISHMTEALKQAAQQCEQNAISISFMPTNDDILETNLDQLDPTFMYIQLLKEILLTIKFNEKHFEEYINYCHTVFVENEKQLKNVDKLQTRYRVKTPIWWYTCEFFLYKMLNRALRLMDVDIIIKMGFFIVDLHCQIEKLYSEQFSDKTVDKTLVVYRGQGMSTIDFKQMAKIKGGLMSFNNFLSTSKKHKVSCSYAVDAGSNFDMVGILFVITVNPAKSTTPFASINEVSRFGDLEDEVLFSMNSIFRIGEITPMERYSRVFQVNLTLTSDNDKDLCALTNRIRKETFPHEKGWHRLGLLLFKLGQSDKASQVYEVMLSQITTEREKARIYERLGAAQHSQGKYKIALNLLEKVVEIYQKDPARDDRLVAPYIIIGMIYNDMRDYAKALSSYQKSLEIQRRSLSPNHPDFAKSYNNIGEVYLRMGKYFDAHSSFDRARNIQDETLPSNDPDRIYPYKNLGDVYEKMGDRSRAYEFYKHAVDIGQRSLPSNHRDLQQWKNNLNLLKQIP